MPQHVRGTVEADEEPEQKYYKPHFLQMPPAEVVVQEGKFFRLDAKVSFKKNLLFILQTSWSLK